jgi:thiol-disulfide isomerase/thioredoxin
MKKTFTLFVALFMALCAQAQISATPQDFGTILVTKGGAVKVPVTIKNESSGAIRSLVYTITKDGVESAQKTATASVPIGGSAAVNFVFQAETEPKKSVQTITIHKVNSQPNASEKKSATGNIVTIKEKPIVLPLVEEFTGTWCGWCPIGFDGMEKAHEIYGDKVALIAIHAGDLMEARDFSAIAARADGYPSAIINRGATDFYPSNDEIKSKIDSEIQNKVSAGTIQVSASWTNATKTSIKMETKTTFVYSDDNGNYGIAFALTQDGMHGTGSEWAQTNNLSNNSDFKNSNPFWYKSPSRVANVKFNHVAVAAWNIADGIKNSVNPIITAGEEQTFTHTVSIAAKSLIQDKDQLHVIAILIDRTTGAVVNAAQTTISDETTGVKKLEPTSLNFSRYFTLDGKEIPAPQRGVNIVRQSDGTTKKIFVN